MKFGSVCSGIEAASVAFHPLGMSAAWLAEVDVAASTVLSHRLGATAPRFLPSPLEPKISDKERKARQTAIKNIGRQVWGNSVVNWGDMTKLPAAVLAGEAEAPEVLCGGTPCQSFSIAGLRGGMSDGRGQLTLSFVELANAIDFKRAERGEQPCTILWENVPGIFSDKTNAFGCFLAGLTGEDLPLEPPGGKWKNAGVVLGPKRAIAWIVKDAQFFGLAQRRRRVFVIASSREGFDPAKVLFEFDGLRRDSAPSREARQDVTHSIAPCLTGSGRGVARTGDPSGQDPVVACYGPERSAGVTFRMVAFGEYSEDGSASTIKARDYKDATDLVVSPDVIAMGRREDGDAQWRTMSVRRLMPIEAERLQGFDDNWTLVPVGKGLAADGPRYKQIGNSWAVNCVRWIGARLVDHLRELDQPKNDNNPLHAWMVAA